MVRLRFLCHLDYNAYVRHSGSKHWPKQLSDQLWSWITDRLDRIFAQIKPDTLNLWEGIVNLALEERDPRRTPALVSWVLSLPLDLQSDSAFASKLKSFLI